MSARMVQVPAPCLLRSLSATGPISPRSARSAEAARLSLYDALAQAAEDEARDHGWCVWWSSPASHAGHVVRLDLWVDDDTSGQRSLEAVQGRLEAAGFMVRVSGRPSTPEAVVRGERPLHARLREAHVGQLFGDLPVTTEVVADLEEVHVPPSWRWPVQPCPACGHRGHPVERIWGFPSREGQLAVALGEAALAGCLVDDEDDHDAECSSCGVGFRPRRR
jgi:hypothetical protein